MPIVAVTANAMREDFERCREAGMDDFVAKPVTPRGALANAIERAVSASRGRVRPSRRAAGPDRRRWTWRRSRRSRTTSVAPTRSRASCACSSSSSTPQAEQIDAAARGGEHESLARIAHRMRSSAATLGATGLADILALETAAPTATPRACDQLAASFANQVASTRATFEEILARPRRHDVHRQLTRTAVA